MLLCRVPNRSISGAGEGRRVLFLGIKPCQGLAEVTSRHVSSRHAICIATECFVLRFLQLFRVKFSRTFSPVNVSHSKKLTFNLTVVNRGASSAPYNTLNVS
jgi:hypothetical protein